MDSKVSPPPPYTEEPTHNPPYPQSPMYGQQQPVPPYPTSQPQYPTGQPQYPTGQPQYPTGQPQYPTGPLPAPTMVTGPTIAVYASGSFGEHPTNMKCPYCHEQVITRTSYVGGALAWIICASLAFAGLFLIIPFFFCCVPFCMSSCQDVEHYCPKCNRMVGTYRRMR